MRIKLVFFTLFFLFLGIKPVLAVSVTISNIPSAISDQAFEFNVSIIGASAGTNYLRANFFTAGTTKYFGYTYNGNSFVNSSICPDYLPITIDSSGNWNGKILAKIDTSSNYYTGLGSYNFKVRRYTQSCSSSYIWSNEVTTVVSNPSLYPTPTPTSTQDTSSSNNNTSTNSQTPDSSTSLFTISNIHSQVNSDQSFSASVNLSLPNNPNTNFFLKGAFKKPDGSNYFGLSKVSENWIKNGSSYSSQLPITTDSSGNWSGSLEVQPDSEDSGFIGSGDYIFKVGRYTSSGSGPNWSNELTINIFQTNPTSQQDTTNQSPNITPTSPKSKTIQSTIPSSTSNLTNKNSGSKIDYRTASIAGINSSATNSATLSAKIETKNKKPTSPFLITGLGLVIAGIGSLGYIYLKVR